MDPICGAVGLAAGVASIVTVIGKSIRTLATLRQKYKEAELNIVLLTGHLRTVCTALLQVQNWAECLTGESRHYQFMIDLEDAVKHCKLLVEYIDNQISKFDWNSDEELGAGTKVLYLLEDQATRDCLTRLDHQINALNLCLTAFQCRTPKDQKRLLEKRESRNVFEQARDDAASLATFRDAESFVTARTSTSRGTRFSKTFDFDALLLTHRIYQNSFRYMLRRASSPTEEHAAEKKQQRTLSDTPLLSLRGTARHSARIDSKLKEDARKLSKEVKILAVGDRHGRSAIVKRLRQRYGRPIADVDVEQYRQTITSLALKALVAILDYVKDLGTGLVSQSSRDHADLIRDFAVSAGPDWKVSLELASAVRHIWHIWHVRQAFSVMQQHGQTAYYLNSIERICQPDYTPTNMDIVRCPETIDTMKETGLVMNSMSLRIVEINEQVAIKIISQFADVQFCLFAIDMTCYDRYLDDAKQTNELKDRLTMLKSICRSKFFSRSIILLVLTNGAALEKQIVLSPLKSHFDDYEGGNDAHAAVKYVLKRCRQANRQDLPLFWHMYDWAADEAEAESMDHFLRQSAASITAVSWLREIGLGVN